MSIFPKRTVPGGAVTIHWNFNIAHLANVHVCPWVRIGVKDPLGKETMLFEGHVMGLPDPPSPAPEEAETHPPLKYLKKSLPLMVMAEYLSGQVNRETLVNILQNIQSGRHYYFPFHLPIDAPLGKYTLISEVHSQGEIRYSKTAADDFFFVEKVSCQPAEGKSHTVVAINHSSEPTPVKVVHCHTLEDHKTQTELEVFLMEGQEKRRIEGKGTMSFLLYNEERETLPFLPANEPLLWRNQQVLELRKPEGPLFLLPRTTETGVELTPEAADVWDRANGLITAEGLTTAQQAALESLKAEGLISELRLSSSQ